VETKYISSVSNPEQLEEITKLAEENKIKTFIEHVFPLSEAKKAQKLSKERHTRGKIILVP
jgi:NADPH:quinone reductase-like Zn-dependent oxidoreductase